MSVFDTVGTALASTDIASSITGRTQKAIIKIKQDSAAPNTKGAAGSANAMAAAASALASTAASAAGAAVGGAAAAAGAAGGAAAGTGAAAQTYQMNVQYNPSSISFRAGAESVPFQYLQEHIDIETPIQRTQAASITMSVRLIFDQMSISDCFMLEHFKPTTQTVAQAITTKGFTNTKVHSVQKVTNAFIGMLMNEKTRMVTFQWATMSFSGEVTQVRAIYTMFSTKGRPVRSEVTLSISQRVLENEGDKYWDSAFEKCFSATGEDVAGGKKGKEIVPNLLNISL